MNSLLLSFCFSHELVSSSNLGQLCSCTEVTEVLTEEQNLIFRTFDMDKDACEVQKALWRNASLRFFSPFSEWDHYLETAINFQSVLILHVNRHSFLSHSTAVVTGDGDQAKRWRPCPVLSPTRSHFYIPKYICWNRDTHCGFLRVFRSGRTPAIRDRQFCQDHPARLTQSAELSTRTWFQWVCPRVASSQRSSPRLRVLCPLLRF